VKEEAGVAGRRQGVVAALLLMLVALGAWALAGYVLLGATVQGATGTTDWPGAIGAAVVLAVIGVAAMVGAAVAWRRGRRLL
jgi:hypothetical protein